MIDDIPTWTPRHPFIIGFAGGTGSGKSTIAESVASCDPAIQILRQDAYYRHLPELTYEERAKLNYDHPDSLEFDLLVGHLEALRRGEQVDTPQYDFTTHLRAVETLTISPAPVLIVEGILVLAEESVRDMLDLRIFIDTDADLRLVRRLRRDIDERGRTISSVLTQYEETVRPMHIEYVESSKRHADVIIPGGYNPGAVAMVTELIRSRLLP